MAQLKAGSTVGGVAMLLKLKPSNLTEGAGTAGQFLGVDVNNNIKFLTAFTTQAQGSVSGFTSGGAAANPSPAIPAVSTIDKFPFAGFFATASSVGSLATARSAACGQSSSTSGYTSGGASYFNPIGGIDGIEKYPFTAPFATATSVGSFPPSRYASGYFRTQRASGQSSTTDGYVSGGMGGLPGPMTVAMIDKFPFSAPFTTSTSTSNLSQSRWGSAGQSSATEGYASGPSVIDKFPFSAPFTTATNVGSLSQGRSLGAGQSSATHGFTSGGDASGASGRIDKFPFAVAPSTAASVGSLIQGRIGVAGHSFSTYGYTSGGIVSTPVATADIFPFSMPVALSTVLGQLTQSRATVAGQQY